MCKQDDKPLSDGDVWDEFPVVWREKLDGLTAEVRVEEYIDEQFNPRDCEGNFGVMVCWHPDYILGDFQIKDGDGRGAVENEHPHSGRVRSMTMLARWARVAERAPVVIPLYLYDHSGISISTGMALGETLSGGYDEFGNPRGWDTTLCGIIYASPENIVRGCGDENYVPADFEGTREQWIAQNLESEVELYDRYLRGEVYYYRVADGDGETLDSCGGYLPDVSVKPDAELDYLKDEARDALRSEVESRRSAAETERAEAARAADLGIPTCREA